MPSQSSPTPSASGAAVARSAPASSSSSPSAGPVELSAQELHAVAVQAFRIGNRGRMSLCESLRVLSETRLYYDLGFPGIAAYADAFFQLRRAEAYEHVRVANALLELTELRDAFVAGQIGWSVLKAVTRIASADSQATWIDFALRNGGENTLAEARDARLRGRDKPRTLSFGLPNLDQKLVLRFSRSEMEKVRGWIEGTCATVAEKTGTEGVSMEQALLFLCENGMTPETGEHRGPTRAQIVYQCCPDCRKGRMGTREGFVEVASEEIDRHECCAEVVVIDGATPPKMRRRILAREAGRCGNPRCSNRADHCHHIKFRSEGGKTCTANEVAVCTTCHALVHAGLLRVTGDADGELHWSPVAVPDSLRSAVAADRAASDSLPVPTLDPERADGKRSPGDRLSSDADSLPGAAAHRCGLNLEELAHCLVGQLGVPVARSRRIIRDAVEGLPRDALTEENVLRRALAAI